jgi:hypothetical protein
LTPEQRAELKSLAALPDDGMDTSRRFCGVPMVDAAKLHRIVQNRKMAATADEDGHCCFAVVL